MARLLGYEVPDELAAYVAEKAGHQDTAGFDAALASDRERAEGDAQRANFSRAASLYRGRDVGAPATPEVPSAVQEYVAKRQMAMPKVDPLDTLKKVTDIEDTRGKGPREAAKLSEDRAWRTSQAEDQRAWRTQEAEKDRSLRDALGRLVKPHAPMQGRPTIKQDDDGNMIAVDPNTSQSSPILDNSGKPVRANDRGFETDTQRLGDDLQYIAKMPGDLALLKSYAGKSKPGVGPVVGSMPDWAISKNGVEVRKAVSRLFNAMVYMSSGKQINESEAERMATAWLDTHNSDEAIDTGVKDLEDQMKLAARTFYAKYEPRVLDAFGARGGFDTMQGFAPSATRAKGPVAVPAGAGPGAKPGVGAGGSVVVLWKGKRKEIPAERLEEALQAGAQRAE